MMKPIVCLIFCCFSHLAFSQPPDAQTSSEIFQSIKKLKVLGSVLYIAAHPDDENTRLLTYFSKEKLYKTGYLSLTRGDGGQNLIGDEQGIALGLIRTQELLKARKIDGASQFFTTAFDFGYSKTPEETLEKWNREKILGDMVWVIRNFKPDVMITRFPVTGEGGHGHHTASAILAQEAFMAAADKNRFPEQLKFTGTWQAKRLLWNTFNFGSVNTQKNDQFSIDAGGFNPLLGQSYGEIAANSRSQHRSQGFGVPKSRGESKEYFVLTGGDAFETDLFDDIETDWKKLPGGEAVEKAIDSLIRSFNFSRPSGSLKSLLNIYRLVENLQPSPWRSEKLSAIKNIIAAASGLWMEAYTHTPSVAQGDSLKIHFVLNDRTSAGYTINRIRMEGFDSSINAKLPSDKNFSFSTTVAVDTGKSISQPYWLIEPMKGGSFSVSDQKKIGQPDADPAFTVFFDFEMDGQPLSFNIPVFHKYTDPVKGEKYQPLVVVPRETVSGLNDVQLINTAYTKPTVGRFTVTAQANNQPIIVQVNDSVLFRSEAPFKKNESAEITYPIRLQKNLSNSTHTIYSGKEKLPAFVLHHIQYDHIPYVYFFTDAKTRIAAGNIQTAGHNIGYITGAGDKVPDALQQMGYKVTLLTEYDLTPSALKKFDAVITGVRAYNTNEWLDKSYSALMEYVYKGGNLIVQYNTSNQIGPLKSRIGPYPFNISRTRVTEEDAVVRFANPSHRILHFPNKITAADFDHWVQERSVYHAADWSDRYTTVLSMNDAGEKPGEGSLITASYGKGNFTYTGISFFRQLPAGVPGAYRLLANIIALNQKQTKQ